MRQTLKIIALVILLAWAAAQAVSFSGRASVVDGDTIEVRGVTIRLWGIDAVESRQTCLDARSQPCQKRRKDRFGRVVAVCSVGGVNINRWLVEQGWALDFARFSGGYFAQAEAVARQHRRGIWQGRFDPPGEWR
jgi:endonuclease YncB( thermonuclease family)